MGMLALSLWGQAPLVRGFRPKFGQKRGIERCKELPLFPCTAHRKSLPEVFSEAERLCMSIMSLALASWWPSMACFELVSCWESRLGKSISQGGIPLKSGKRQGAAESIPLTERSVLRWLWLWKRPAHAHDLLTAKPHIWRAMFTECLESLKLATWQFRPYSPRRGGATFLFTKCGSLYRVLLAGRWTAVKTAKNCLNSGLAMLSEIQIPKKLLHPFHSIFSTWQSSLPSLEHSPSGRRAGGRGKNAKNKKVRQKRGGTVSFKFVFSLFRVLRILKVSRAWGLPRRGGVPKGHWGMFSFLGLGVAGKETLRP